jgi:tetratricopeptide (TPR) repeat protein
MKPDREAWARIYPFLEQAQDIAVENLEGWLAQLSLDHPDIVEPLRDVLRGQRDGATADFLDRAFRLPPGSPSRIGQRVGAYTIQSLLGRGGMGEVWLAERSDGHFKGSFAVKFLDLTAHSANALDRFRREGRVLARLAHPNIARLIDAGATPDGQPYLVLEYVKGEPLDRFCNTRSLGIEGRIRLFLDVLAAVAHAHTNLIVHRDIKPSNVLVTPEGTVKLLDFGIAKLIGNELKSEDLPQATRIEEIVLTPDYAAPEQILGEPPSTATDVYQLGVLLHVLLVGRLPFEGTARTRAERIQAALGEIPGRPSDIAPTLQARKSLRGDLDAVIGKTLRKKPAERYATAAALALDLRHYLDHEPVGARAGAFAYRAAKFIRRYRGAVLGTSVAVVALLVATTFALIQMREAQRQRDQARFHERRGDAENQFLTQIMSTVGSDSRPVTPKQVLDKGLAMLERQYSQDPEFRVDLLIRLASSFLEIGDEAKGYEALMRAESIAKELKDPRWLAEIECDAIQPEIDGGHLDQAVRRLAEGKEALLRIAHPLVIDRARCMTADSLVIAAQGQVPMAIETERQALRLIEAGGETRNIVYNTLLGQLSIFYSESGDMQAALQLAERQVDNSERNGWGESENGVVARHNLAVTLLDVGEVRSASEQEKEVVARLRSGATDGLIEAPMSTVYGVMLLRLNRLPEAQQSIDDSIRSALRDGDVLSEVYARGALAKLLIATGHLDLASAEIAKVRQLTKGKERENRRPLAATAITESLLLRTQGNLGTARRLIEATLERALADNSGPSGYLGNAYAAASRIALADRRFADAETAAAKSVAVFEKRARKPELSANVGEALLLLAEAQRGQDKIAESRAAAARAVVSLSSGLGVDNPLTIEANALR